MSNPSAPHSGSTTPRKSGPGPLLVRSYLEINESVQDDTIVEKNGILRIRGNIKGSLTIEKGASVIVDGSVDGKVINRGGKLVVNNLALAEFVSFDGPPEAEAGGTLSIFLSAIASNWSALARRTEAECAAVVKADAYGCGIDPITSALGRAGCRTFFVSNLAEARRVRAAVRDATIYVLNGLYPGTGPSFVEINARPVIGSLVEIAEWDVFVASSQWQGGFALNVDIGASRCGIALQDASALAARSRLSNHGITLLMSHLDNARKPDHPLNDRQIRLFQDMRQLYRGIPASLANSSGMFLGPRTHYDLVRPGAALYGVNPTPGAANPMRPAIELRARIVQLRNVQRGETIAFKADWTAKRPTLLALVPVGYADGYPRMGIAPNHTLQAIVGGQRCPLLGCASMDLLAIDVTDLPDPAAARRGEMVTLIGEHMGVDNFAAAAKSTEYELLTSLGRRFHRIYYAT
jgi:alanine racemase